MRDCSLGVQRLCSEVERDCLLASLLDGGTYGDIPNALQDKVGSRTLEGRRLRRHVLKGAVIVFITAGYSGKKFIFEKVGHSSTNVAKRMHCTIRMQH